MGNACGIYQGKINQDICQSMPANSSLVPDSEHKKAKVLILGAAESGKSTICRHMRQLHGDKFGDAEMLNFKQTIRASCLEYFVDTVSDIIENEPLLSKDRQECLELVRKYREKTDVDRSYLNVAVSVWLLPSVQEYISEITTLDSVSANVNDEGLPEDGQSRVQRDNTVQRLHSDNPANHFLRCFDKILAEGYTPKLEDILNMRIPTTGLVETKFTRGNLTISLIDVGGQRSERKKWLHCFDSVNAVVFVVAMSEYDQVLSEDATVNRMQESLKLFSTVCNIKWFLKASMLLFLNKKDVFDEKIVYSPITQCFPEYTGADDKYEASNYIWQQFGKQNKCNRGLYFHFVNAKDTQNINVVFDVVVDTIIHSNMSELGFQ